MVSFFLFSSILHVMVCYSKKVSQSLNKFNYNYNYYELCETREYCIHLAPIGLDAMTYLRNECACRLLRIHIDRAPLH